MFVMSNNKASAQTRLARACEEGTTYVNACKLAHLPKTPARQHSTEAPQHNMTLRDALFFSGSTSSHEGREAVRQNEERFQRLRAQRIAAAPETSRQSSIEDAPGWRGDIARRGGRPPDNTSEADPAGGLQEPTHAQRRRETSHPRSSDELSIPGGYDGYGAMAVGESQEASKIGGEEPVMAEILKSGPAAMGDETDVAGANAFGGNGGVAERSAPVSADHAKASEPST